MRRLLIAIATASLCAVLFAPAAHASPKVVESSPAEGAEEHQAPDNVSITFDMPLDGSSVIKVVDGCGRRIDNENTTVQLNEMSVGIAKKPAGEYKVLYYANPPAGATGSSTGTFSFTVHAGPSCGPETKQHHHGDSGQQGGGHEDHGSGGNETHEGHESTNNHQNHAAGDADSSAHDGSSGHTDHSAMSSGAPHASVGHAGHGKAPGDHTHRDKSSGGNKPQATGGAPGPRAAPGDAFALSDGQTILISLGACLILGVAGGWMIRTTDGARRKVA